MKTIKTGFAALALGAILAACGGGYDRGDAIDEMTDQGLSEVQAECVIDRLEDEIGEDRLGSDDEPTAEEQEIIIAAAQECAAGGSDDETTATTVAGDE